MISMETTKTMNKIPSAFNSLVEGISQLIIETKKSHYKRKDIAMTIVGASLQKSSIEYTARAPNGDTVFLRLKSALTIEKLKQLISNSRPRIRSKVVLAIDGHVEMFYGKKDAKGVVGTVPKNGTSRGYEYLVAKIITGNKEYIVDILPIYDNRLVYNTIEMIKELRKIYNISLILADAEFRTIELFDYLICEGIHFITKMKSSKKLKSANIQYNKAVTYSSIYDGERGKYNLLCKDVFVYRAKSRKKYNYYLTSDMKRDAAFIIDTYRMRWKIETGFREINRMEIKTTTRNSLVRLLFYVVSTLVYNVWIEIRLKFFVRLNDLKSLLIDIIIRYFSSKEKLLRIVGLS
jgi:hypothetical protein